MLKNRKRPSGLPEFCLLQQETDFKKDIFECGWVIRSKFLLPEFASRAICTGKNPDPIMFSHSIQNRCKCLKDLDGEVRGKMMHKLTKDTPKKSLMLS